MLLVRAESQDLGGTQALIEIRAQYGKQTIPY